MNLLVRLFPSRYRKALARQRRYILAKKAGMYSGKSLSLAELEKIQEKLGITEIVPGKSRRLGRPRSKFYVTRKASEQRERIARIHQKIGEWLEEELPELPGSK